MAATPDASSAAQPTPHVALRKVEAVVNGASGSVGPDAAHKLQNLLDGYGLDANVAAPEPAGIGEAVKAARDRNPDLLITLAGDGTAGLAASLCGADGPLLICLPGGTMNMLPFSLHGQRSWEEALHASLGQGRPTDISGGEIGGKPFYVAAMLGEPTLWAKVREAVRAHSPRRVATSAFHALRRLFVGRLRFCLDEGRPTKTVALTLMCPRVSRGLPNDAQALEAAELDIEDAWAAFRLGVHMLAGDWRRDPGVQVHAVKGGRLWARGRIAAILDGESTRFTKDIDFRFVPVAFRALVPDDAQGAGRP